MKISAKQAISHGRPGVKARYYQFNATEDTTSQTVTAGAYKVFPPSSSQ